MRTWALVAVLLGVALPTVAEQRVSVEQLEQILAQGQSMPDADLAAKLSELQLTERLSGAQLAHWKSALNGAKSQRVLTGLADRSAFLAPPASEIPQMAAPDLAEQRRIMGLAAAYVSKAIPQLPKFYATRTITHFEDAPGSANAASPNDGGALHAVRISHATVLYRDGEEVAEPGPVKVDNKVHGPDRGLRTWGVFGPILGLVLLDAAQNRLAWSRWEKGANGSVAVFSYAVPRENSHYEVRYCCVASAYGLESNSFQEMSGYHGEMSVDPTTGTIVRLTVDAAMEPNDPISRAAAVVEYGPMELGGTTYICPQRSISIAVAKTIKQVKDPSGRSYPAMGPQQMLLNDAEFGQYHLFRAESHILSNEEARSAGAAPDVTLASTPLEVLPADEELADAPVAKPAAEAAAANADAPEISTAVATGLPESPAHPADQPAESQAPAYTLRLNARLVDVNVVALDKKGHPIADLKPEDFEVYDNGVKQNVRSFNRADTGASAAPPAAAVAMKQAEFSNHGLKAPVDDRNTVVILIDGSNLAFTDYVYVRQQTTYFLETLPEGERVALYAMKYHGFQILHEPTTDHAALAAMMKKWLPTAQDRANGDDQEQRNRQQFETVHSPEDMLSVNGNYTMDTGTQKEAQDAKLRELGSNPGPNALIILVDVARQLASIPGHKSLVWITSDNALADWNKNSISIEKGSKSIEPIALRTQEAMNNAHVSVYPLDASGLEGGATKADIGRRNVELTPTYQLPQYFENMLEGPEATSGQDMNPYVQNKIFSSGGRLTAQMEQDIHAIQGVFREVADATGGRTFRRSSNIVGQLDAVMVDGQATYLLGFTPTVSADGQYHLITVKLAKHSDAVLRYRTGYQYDAEPTTLKDRFRKAIWEAADQSEIAVSTKPITDAEGHALRVTVAGGDLSLAQQSALWTGKLDIFLVQRDDLGQNAKVSGQTVGLRLKPATYQRAMNEGLTFDERIESKPGNGSNGSNGSLRVVVVDVNSGRMGSVTVPSAALASNP
jgi:VWFA-related protein